MLVKSSAAVAWTNNGDGHPKACTPNFLLCQNHVTYTPSQIESKKMDIIHGFIGLVLMVVIKCQTGKKNKPHNFLI